MDNKQDVRHDKLTQERFQMEQLRKESGLKDEEYAAELAVPAALGKLHDAEPYRAAGQTAEEAGTFTEEAEDLEAAEQAVSRSRAFGYLALFIAIGSLFVWPALLGPAAVALGFFAFLRGNKALGSWSMALGLIAVAAYFFLVPYYA